MHGGGAPQVKRSARDRLELLIDPAIEELERVMLTSESDAVRLAAARDILDRVLGKAQQPVDVTSGGQLMIKAYVGIDLERASGSHLKETIGSRDQDESDDD